MGHRLLDENEGGAPDEGEPEEQAPLAAIHDIVDHRLRIAAIGQGGVLTLAFKTFTSKRRHPALQSEPDLWRGQLQRQCKPSRFR